MALIDRIFGMVFGSGSNVVRDAVEVFRENAEAAAGREAARADAALDQFAQEFIRDERSGFDRVMDGVNRIPRPAMALGTLALFGAAMGDPAWFAQRMAGLAAVPEPLWWLLGVIVSFYFGARHQAKGQEFQTRILRSLTRPVMADPVMDRPVGAQTPASADTGRDADLSLEAARTGDNPALETWRRTKK